MTSICLSTYYDIMSVAIADPQSVPDRIYNIVTQPLSCVALGLDPVSCIELSTLKEIERVYSLTVVVVVVVNWKLEIR